jgi:hypothetical protein
MRGNNYQYTRNPYSYLATASWQPFDYRQVMNQQAEEERRARLNQ